MENFWHRKLTYTDASRLALVLVVMLGLFCVALKRNNDEVVQTLESSYSRALYELVEYLDNVETLLAKSQISSSAEYAAKNLTEVWRKADLAQASLSQIPITHVTLEKTEQFLNQLSDYSYSLSHKAMEGKSLTEEEMKNVADFYDRCKVLNSVLNSLATDMGNGSLSWEELTKKQNNAPFAQEVANLSQDSFGKIEENMQDYEGLIYDGPFSEHMTSTEPLGLGPSGDVSNLFDEKRAEEVVYEYVAKEQIEALEYKGVVEANIRVHRFEGIFKDGSKIDIDVSVQGGKVIWFLVAGSGDSIQVLEENKAGSLLDFNQAKEFALAFLKAHEIENMKETYYITENGMVTINFAYVEKDTNLGDIVCYPDLLKVKVSLVDGSVIGMEAQSYYSSHHARKITLPKISIEEAKAKINQRLEIVSEGIAVIPTDFKTELTTYEFKGRIDENEFIVYVNVETGDEEKIFMILETPNGVLTT